MEFDSKELLTDPKYIVRFYDNFDDRCTWCNTQTRTCPYTVHRCSMDNTISFYCLWCNAWKGSLQISTHMKTFHPEIRDKMRGSYKCPWCEEEFKALPECFHECLKYGLGCDMFFCTKCMLWNTVDECESHAQQQSHRPLVRDFFEEHMTPSHHTPKNDTREPTDKKGLQVCNNNHGKRLKIADFVLYKDPLKIKTQNGGSLHTFSEIEDAMIQHAIRESLKTATGSDEMEEEWAQQEIEQFQEAEVALARKSDMGAGKRSANVNWDEFRVVEVKHNLIRVEPNEPVRVEYQSKQEDWQILKFEVNRRYDMGLSISTSDLQSFKDIYQILQTLGGSKLTCITDSEEGVASLLVMCQRVMLYQLDMNTLNRNCIIDWFSSMPYVFRTLKETLVRSTVSVRPSGICCRSYVALSPEQKVDFFEKCKDILEDRYPCIAIGTGAGGYGFRTFANCSEKQRGWLSILTETFAAVETDATRFRSSRLHILHSILKLSAPHLLFKAYVIWSEYRNSALWNHVYECLGRSTASDFLKDKELERHAASSVTCKKLYDEMMMDMFRPLQGSDRAIGSTSLEGDAWNEVEDIEFSDDEEIGRESDMEVVVEV